MFIYRISGASDDLVEIGGDFQEEYNVIRDGPYMGYLLLGGRLKVHVLYDGCWSFAPSMVEEDIPIPAGWEISFGQGNRSYSMCLTVATDEKVYIEFIKEAR